ncbi:hypothetical protein RHGRI_002744 [Rhododendron griersonianum]|uniref:Uncharacterized protein n=1 Tax=Rhododendron griersonianum TaxID=479676 RepID=A0AAV6LR30_9ERIC|nr:hypothetical protein RHGRI_002744 [Rhododendron griersonianum]
MAVAFSSSSSLFLAFRASHQESVEEVSQLQSIVTSPFSFSESILRPSQYCLQFSFYISWYVALEKAMAS